jgi:hypothetical protein
MLLIHTVFVIYIIKKISEQKFEKNILENNNVFWMVDWLIKKSVQLIFKPNYILKITS